MKFRLNEQLLYEMANVKSSDTGLPYDLWIDSIGVDRKNTHNNPRLKVNVDGQFIPMEISDNPDIPDSVKKKGITDFKNKALIQRYIKAYKEILLAHYNKQISDKQALSLLGTFKTADDAKLSLADIIDITPNVVIEYSYDSVNYLWCIEVYSNSKLISTSYELSEKDLFAKLNELKSKYNPTRITHRDN